MTLVYLLVARSVESIRSNLSKQKEAVPVPDEEYEGSTYSESFVSISYEALFGGGSEVKPITEHKNRSIFPYLVYSFWGLLASIVMYALSGGILAWLVTRGNLNSVTDIAVSGDIVQNAPLGSVDLLLAIFPIFEGLSFEDRVLIGGVMFFTGSIFLTAARNLTEISDDVHRRFLRFVVSRNPLVKNELINALFLAIPYALVVRLV